MGTKLKKKITGSLIQSDKEKYTIKKHVSLSY